MRHRKRICLLTGASGRLGTAFCRLHSDKYDIAAVYRTRLPIVPSQKQWFVDPLEDDLRVPDNHGAVYAVQADLTCDCEIERVVDTVLAHFDRIDLVVNAAVHSVWGPIVDGDRLLRTATSQFVTNVVTPLKVASMVAKKFWRDRDRENVRLNRNVVNVSSVAGLRIYSGLGQSIYGASKAALNHLTRHMAQEFFPIGVRVNATAPNSFPDIVPIRHAVRTIVRLDRGTMTGKILIVDENGQRLI
jgi:NAD(P)-dependent dehydrogenase (short-subunit alcohol dehydrogenase family)